MKRLCWKNTRKLIDANIILRYLLNDNPEMSEKAKEIINDGAFTIPEVMAEVIYVLKGVYKVERQEISDVLQEFLKEIKIENYEGMREALQIFKDTSLDFVDCILIARNRILKNEVVSFDKKLNKVLAAS